MQSHAQPVVICRMPLNYWKGRDLTRPASAQRGGGENLVKCPFDEKLTA